MRFHLVAAVLIVATLDAGCADTQRPLAPRLAATPSFSMGGAAACPTPATVVVTDEAGLNAALAAASPGEVIGLGAFFGVSADVLVNASNITLTCAVAGAGVFATNPGVIDMLEINGAGVTVDRLVLDASASSDGPAVANNDGITGFATALHFTRNTVTCGPGICLFLVGSTGAVVSDNQFTAGETFTGVHIQESNIAAPDNTVVAGNTIVATAPSIADPFGAIRVHTGFGVTISGNVVTGPWKNSTALTSITAGVVENNRLEDALLFGIRLSSGSFVPSFVTQTTFRNNRVTGSGQGGGFADKACGNTFFGNNLNGNAGDIGLIFPETSGANVLSGNQNVVIDDGAWDCDGDGVNDPNIITGKGKVLHGASLAPLADMQQDLGRLK